MTPLNYTGAFVNDVDNAQNTPGGSALSRVTHRSELLSLSLEAEKQSARHLQATADASSELTR